LIAYVLVSFMSDSDVRLTRSGRLLSLLRRLIDYGKELTVSLRSPSSPKHLGDILFPYGTRDIALILQRITRGLQLAFALEARVVRTAARLDAVPRAAAAGAGAAPTKRASAALRPTRSQPPPDPRLARMPTPEQIAAAVRRRPIAAVLSDICRDLGIMRYHPLWNEIRDTVIEFGGNYATLFGSVLRQALNILKEKRPPPAPTVPSASTSTGPPRRAAA
jgi:hypothetical protein